MNQDSQSIAISKVITSDELQKCLAIRAKVFIEGQKVPLAEELDGKDEESDHYLLTIEKVAVGVARVRYIDNTAKVERVAILDKYQGKGLGKQLMQAIIHDLKHDKGIKAIKLSSQSHAILFYKKLGFKVCSDEYMDAGIPHKDMLLNVN